MTGDIQVDQAVIRNLRAGRRVSIGYFKMKKERAAIGSIRRLIQRRCAIQHGDDGSSCLIFVKEGRPKYQPVTHRMDRFTETISYQELKERFE